MPNINRKHEIFLEMTQNIFTPLHHKKYQSIYNADDVMRCSLVFALRLNTYELHPRIKITVTSQTHMRSCPQQGPRTRGGSSYFSILLKQEKIGSYLTT